MDETQPTYEVVSYGDVREVARDAAETALERESVRTDEDIRAVADAAVESANAAEGDRLQARVDDALSTVAKQAADDAAVNAVEGVQQTLDEQLGELQQRSETLESVSVELDETQYQAIMTEMQATLGACFLCMCLCAVVVGLNVWSMIARDFR